MGDTSSPTIRVFTLGPFETNCYVVSFDGSPACWIVDAGFDPGEMIEHVTSAGLRPEAVVLTHAHADHIAGLEKVRGAYPGVPVLIHAAEREFLTDPVLNLSAGMGLPIRCRAPDRLLEGEQELELSGRSWRVLHTPGHSPGGIALVHDESGTALVGDTLFKGSIGRTDFPTSDHEALERSIRERLYRLPDTTKVYPGHGPVTTIGAEKRGNPYVRAR